MKCVEFLRARFSDCSFVTFYMVKSGAGATNGSGHERPPNVSACRDNIDRTSSKRLSI